MSSEPDRIPVTRSVEYAVRGAPEVQDEYNPSRTIAPTGITIVYREAPGSQLGRVHAYVKGWWMENGARVPGDKPVGRYFHGDPAQWPEWLASEVRLHDPAHEPPRVDQPPALTDAERAMLRYALELADDRIASRGDEFTDEDRAAVESLKQLAGEDVTPDYTEARGYQVVGDWGVDYAEDEDHARRQVARALSAYPSCGARAEWRIERTWDDGAEYTGPWIPLT